MAFWETATTEQKLAQIDGGIECGLTSRQVATNCGTTPSAILGFAARNGRDFSHIGHTGLGEGGRKRIAEAAQVRGHKRMAGLYGAYSDAAFSIFDNEPSEPFELNW